VADSGSDAGDVDTLIMLVISGAMAAHPDGCGSEPA